MARPVEKALISITVAGIGLVAVALWPPIRSPDASGVPTTMWESTIPATPKRTSAANPPSSTSPSRHPTSGPVADTVDTRATIGTSATTIVLPPGDSTTPGAASPSGHPSASPRRTNRTASGMDLPETTVLLSTTESSVVSTAPPATPSSPAVPPDASLSSTIAPTATPPTPRQPEVPGRCALVEEVWKWDGHPVEDPCTLAEVKRVMRWAWTGTDEQRRSAIRNSHLLDGVFAALEEVGREVGAGVFHSATRGEWSVRFRNIRWHGGPHFDRAVIAVDYSFRHPDYQPGPWRTVTLVQVDGDWKLSYRRGYCRMVTPSLEYHGLAARCPSDPNPEVNEDEYPDMIEDS